MDIRKWLDATAQSLPALHPSNLAESASTSEKVVHIRPTKRKHRQHSSDSSLLEVCSWKEQGEARPADQLRSAKGLQSEISHPTSAQSSKSSPSEYFARRSRRKTQPERYVPQPKGDKKRGKHARSKKNESKVSKRRTRRKKGDRPGSDIAQNFHAKNVFGDRLTLKPREQYGIFNKGKSSTATKSRGLPDLVFSEMRFLQKGKSQSNAIPKPEISRERSRKENSHKRKDEISAFFAAAPPALVKTDGNAQKHRTYQGHCDHSRVDQYVSAQKREADVVLSTIEDPDKTPYLGFGRRGPRHESTSYVSWSESVRGPSVPKKAKRDRSDAYLNGCNQSTTRSGQLQDNASSTNHIHALSSFQTRASLSANEAPISSIAISIPRPSYSQPCLKSRSPQQQADVGDSITRSHNRSSALQSSVTLLPNEMAASDLCDALDNADSKYQSSQFRAMEPTYDRTPEAPRRQRKGSLNYDSSSSFGDILQKCSSQFRSCHHVGAVPVPAAHPDTSAPYVTLNHKSPTACLQMIRPLPAVQFLENPIQIPEVSQVSHQEMHSQQHLSHPPIFFDGNDTTDTHSYKRNENILESFDALDHVEQDWMDLPEEHDPIDLEESETRGIEQELFRGSIIDTKDDQHDLVGNGFWRPHRLY